MFFTINDDAIIESILSGGFSGEPDGHAIYMRYPLTWILKSLYSILPSVPWYGLFLFACYILAFSVFLGVSIKHFRKSIGIFMMAVCAALWMFVPTSIIVHYTIAASALAATAIMLAAFDGSILFTVVIMALSYCVRRDVFLLSIPFWGVVLLFKYLRNKASLKQIIRMILAVCALCGLCEGINSLAYSSDGWKSYYEYNSARTELVDYKGFAPYQDAREIYEAYGITYDDYSIVENYAYVLDGKLDADFFERVIYVGDMVSVKEPFLTGLFKTFKQYFIWIYSVTEPFTWIAILLYVTLIIMSASQKEWLSALLVLCLGAGRCVIWIYLFYRGRFPDHVMISIIIIEMATLLSILLNELKKDCYKKLTFQIACGVVAIILLIGAGLSVKKNVYKQIEQGIKRESFDVVKEYFDEHADDLFLLDVWTMWDYDRGVFEVNDGQSNYFLAGGWYSGSPVMVSRFETLGVADGGEALEQLDNVYYAGQAGKDYNWLALYLKGDLQVYKEIGDFVILSLISH